MDHGLGGVALLVVMFLDWYDVESPRFRDDRGRSVGKGSAPLGGVHVVDVLLAITAVMAIAVAVMAAAHNTPAVSLAIASLLLTVGVIATIAVIVRAISRPSVASPARRCPER